MCLCGKYSFFTIVFLLEPDCRNWETNTDYKIAHMPYLIDIITYMLCV